MRCAATCLLSLLSIVIVSKAVASERVDVCAQYTNTGKMYHVTAISTNGTELNQETHTFIYNTLSHYIVIFWAQNQASVIEMGAPFYLTSYIGSTGFDQEGRPWQILAYSPVTCWP